ncbi:MAG: NADH:ubiquinone oxidoreductase subunit 6 [Acidimicrobiales bacterium]|jgi:NADH-quinone oxidoreductase subunit J|nr:NADH:ubiquinone oxidoreductase subunit 6 [Acidimicrobiales bacterium]
MVAENIAFGLLAAASVLAALRVVTTQNVVHAALYLVVVLSSIAAIFVLLAAEFVAATQILVYVGAIVVLFLFGIMLTRPVLGRSDNLDNDQRPAAAITALFLLGVLSFALLDAFGDDELPDLDGVGSAAIAAERGTRPVGDAIFSTYLVPFEVVSVLLLAALIGAIVLARRD